MKAEWESSKLAHEATRAEFESYKVRLQGYCFFFFYRLHRETVSSTGVQMVSENAWC